MNTKSEIVKCAFCEKVLKKKINTKGDPYWVTKKIYPDKPPICNHCVDDMMEIVDKNENFIIENMQFDIPFNNYSNCEHDNSLQESNFIKPIEEIFYDCQNIVKNQDEQLKQLINIIRHNQLAANKYTKSNVMIVGNTGTGKTLIANTIAEKFNVPYVIENATQFTENGYKGRDVEDMLYDLYIASGCDIKKTERGIIFIDEIDKKEAKNDNKELTGAKVIESLLTMLQGTKTLISKEERNLEILIDTSFITFIVMGAFEDLKEVYKKRLFQSAKIGFSNEEKDTKLNEYTIEDFEKIGFNSQFIARFSKIIELNQHTKNSLTEIFNYSSAAGITPWKQEFLNYNIELEINEKLVNSIVKKAILMKVGARGISRSFNEKVLILLNKFIDQDIVNKKCILGDNFLEDAKDYKILEI